MSELRAQTGTMPAAVSTVLTFLGTLAILLIVWQGASRAGWIPAYAVPPPSAIGAKFLDSFPEMSRHAVTTTVEIALGFILATVGAVLLAVFIVFFRPIERIAYPWLLVLQVIPKVALGPLLVLWLGFGVFTKVLLAFLLAFFPVLIAGIIGLRSLDGNSVNLMRSMGAGRWEIFRYMQLPSALPQLFGSLKVAITLAVVGALVGEFVGGNEGLGYVLVVANGNMDSTLLFVSLLWISLLALALYALVAAVEKACVSWHVSFRSGLSAL